jgi:hypothetical protein
MKILLRALGALVWTATLASGCGGDSESGNAGGDASCGKVAPCGGDVVGTWKITKSCADSATIIAAVSEVCPAATVQSIDVQTNGTFSFSADGTYTEGATTGGSATVFIPSSCLVQGGVTYTCSLVTLALTVMKPAGVDSISCSDASGGCDCKVVPSTVVTNEAGTYTTSGNSYTTTASDGTSVESSYCIEGNRFHSITVDENNPAKVVADVVASKQ